MREIWKQIDQFYFYISNKGRVKNRFGQIRKLHKGKNGYLVFSAQNYEENKKYLLYVHRLVAAYFLPIEETNECVNHIDGNKENNTLNNLQWATSQENIHHAIETGLTNFSYLQGEKTNFSHYTEKDAKLVIDLLKSNKYTDKEISKITGFPVRSFIAKIRRKETWTYLTKDIDTPLGKAERKTFTYK